MTTETKPLAEQQTRTLAVVDAQVGALAADVAVLTAALEQTMRISLAAGLLAAGAKLDEIPACLQILNETLAAPDVEGVAAQIVGVVNDVKKARR